MLPSWTALGRLTRPGRTLHIRPLPWPQTCGETGLFVDNPGGPVAAGANPSRAAASAAAPGGPAVNYQPLPGPQTSGETGLFADTPGGPVAAGATPSRAVASAAGPWGPAVNYHRLRRPDELRHQPPVLHAGRRLDAGADVDAVGGQGPYR